MAFKEVYRLHKGVTNLLIREALKPEIHSRAFDVKRIVLGSIQPRLEQDGEFLPFYSYVIRDELSGYIADFYSYSIRRKNSDVHSLPFVRNRFLLFGLKEGMADEIDFKNLKASVEIPDRFLRFKLESNSVGPWETQENYNLARHYGMTGVHSDTNEAIDDDLVKIVLRTIESAHY